jgi:polyhydroxyalkanoate synthase
MSDQQGADGAPARDDGAAGPVGQIAERSRRLLIEWLSRNGYPVTSTTLTDPLDLCSTFLDLTAKLMANPRTMVSAQFSLWQTYLDLWQDTTLRILGRPGTAARQGEADDPRFFDVSWQEHEIFNYIKQSYLLTARWIFRTIRDIDGLDPRTRQRAEAYTRQFVNALSPTNFALTNPEVIRATVETGGENLLHGLSNLLLDLEQWGLRLGFGSQEGRLEVGRTLAATRGEVVFRNAFMELIQYAPATDRVHATPILFVPPWVNKFYVFDLRPENSWVRWAVERGHTVFMISWVDPDESLAQASFEDYALGAPIAALDVIERATGQRRVHAVGYCLGGTLLAATAGYLAARGQDRIHTLSLFASLLDFSDPGELGISIDEAAIQSLEERAESRGYLDAAEISMLFNLLRENDLAWSFVVNTYLLGREPFPFDFLYWNADTSRMPLGLHRFYLRNCYQANKLAEPGGISIAGVPIDLRDVKAPAYLLSCREDHIAPWRSAYAGVHLLGGENRFTLSASGHASGVINPPAADRHRYWHNSKCPANPEEWMAGSNAERGSWWKHWDAWICGHGERRAVPARPPGGEALKSLGAAPGRYVSTRT